MTSVLHEIRVGASAVLANASVVRVDEDALDRLAATIDPSAPEPFPEERWTGPPERRVRAVVAWNAVNFGSGWFPTVTKLPGHSGARTLAAHWQTWCATNGVPEASWLAEVRTDDVAALFGQDRSPDAPVRGLLVAFRDAWRELGVHLLDRYAGDANSLVDAAEGRAGRLATLLGALPAWNDRHRHGDIDVPLYKRAQIVSAHLAGALDGRGLGRFDDLAELTAFADNLVPHVLRHHGIITVADDVAARIEAEELFTVGETAEVELRAAAVAVVERLRDRIAALGRGDTTAATLDHRLWQMGQDPTVKARPRHRCRTTFY